MDQDNMINNKLRKGSKRSPASPASPAQRRYLPSEGRAARSRLIKRLKGKTPLALSGAKLSPCYLRPSNRRQPDPGTLGRVQRFLGVARPLFDREITTVWLACALVRVDGGPILDAPRLGPALRKLGFQPIRRRFGNRRPSVWLVPGAPRPRLGRPRAPARKSIRVQALGTLSATPIDRRVSSRVQSQHHELAQCRQSLGGAEAARRAEPHASPGVGLRCTETLWVDCSSAL
jgi:hypothetical protein